MRLEHGDLEETGAVCGLEVPSPQEGKDWAKGLESEHSRDWEEDRILP